MKNKKLNLLFKCSLVYAFAALQVGSVYASGGRCVDDGTHPGQNWQTLCDAGGAQMSQFPGSEAQICQGYPGCVYIPPQAGGRCVDDGTHPGQNWQTLCDAGGAQMSQFPGHEVQICQGYPGCAYIPN